MSYDFYCEEVLSGKTSVSVVAESLRAIAFNNTRPTWETHIVIIPKAHIPRLIDVEDLSLVAELFGLMQKIILEKGFFESNYKIITNGGSYQSTPHLHFHLVSGAPLNTSNPAQSGEMAV